MPYSTPSQGRPGHRRSYSHIAAPPAYASTTPALPRRRPHDDTPKKPTFQLGHDDDDDSSADDDSADEAMAKDDDGRALPPLRLRLKPSPFDAVPFPRTASPAPALAPSSLPFPHVRCPSEDGARPVDPRLVRPSVSRTSSTPILLSNGKPLKSSLKSSSSSPNIPFPPQSLVPSIMFPDLHARHQRARSAPSTPRLEHIDLAAPSSASPQSDSTPPSPTYFPQKNVHFPSQEEGGLATVRVFNRSAKPASLSRLGEETETETEGESSATGWGAPRANSWGPRTATTRARPSYNFPVLSGVAPARHSPLAHEIEKVLSVDIANSSPVPARGAEKGDGNVYLESIGFLRQGPQDPSPKRPLTLTGTMLVRNVTYQKTVAIRFTMDDWHTTNDVVARHEKSLAALPGRFVRGASGALDPTKERVCSPYTIDSIGDAAVPIGDAPAWDRFRFDINLEDCANALETRTMWLVGRYSAASASQDSETASPAAPAEWWDNNMGSNYRVGFERKEQPRPESSEQMYKRGVIVSAPPAYLPTRPTATSPPPKSYPAPPQMSASISLPLSLSEQRQHQQQYAEQKQRQAAMTQSTMAHLKKLNLMNYAAPAAYTPAAESSRAISISSVDSSSTSTSTDSTPLQTPTQGNDESVYVQKSSEQDLDVNVLHEDSAINAPWGVASMAMENGFPATFLPSESGASTPTAASVMEASSELSTSPPFSSMTDALPASKRGALYWPWGSFASQETTPTETKRESPLVTPPVASLLSDIKDRSTASGLGQLAPPQRRKHHPATPSDGGARVNFTLGGSSSSGSDSGSPASRRAGPISAPQPVSVAAATSHTPASWGMLPGSPRPTMAGNASPPYPGSPKRFLSPPLPGSPSGVRSPIAGGARSPLRLSPVNSSSELGGAEVGADEGASAGVSAAKQDDAVYQAFVRQWCFAQAPGPTVGASVGVGAVGTPIREGVNV